MKGRKDSLAAAAELVTAIEELCNEPVANGGVPEVGLVARLHHQ